MSEFRELKERAYQSNMRINDLGLVLFTFGNVSAADRDAGVFAIKPSGVPYPELKPENMTVVDFEGHIVEGDLRPSSDTKTHAVLYKRREAIGGIVHTHSTYATAWAQAQKDIPILGTTHADHLTIDVPCAPPMKDEMIQGDYEFQTGIQILDEFERRGISFEDVQMVLIANHGPFTWGETPEKAVTNSAILEEVAKMAYLSLQISPEAPKLKDSLVKKHYERKHGKDSYYGQE